jgi:hypothetical protein
MTYRRARLRAGKGRLKAVCGPALAVLCLLWVGCFTVLTSAHATAADGAPIDITFEFSPASSSYKPGESITVNFTIVNTMPSSSYSYDDLAYMEKVTNLSVHFSWMAPNEFVWSDVSNSSEWLEPDGLGVGEYALPVSIPADALEQTHSYYFRVEYLAHTAWGNLTYYWGAGTTYRDLIVSSESGADTQGQLADLGPYLAGIAIVLSVGAIGAVLYYRSRRGEMIASSQRTSAGGASGDLNGNSYPVIHPAPGEPFPIEKGFIYLVKEKRPNVAFAMYNEAVGHGAKGMLAVREHPIRLKQMHQFNADTIIWLTRRAGKDHIDPTELSLLSLRMTKFVEKEAKSVVLIEGLEYLITQNDFETVLRFYNHLHDFILSHDCAVVVVVDPRVLSMRELALLERSAKIVEPPEPPETALLEKEAANAAAE